MANHVPVSATAVVPLRTSFRWIGRANIRSFHGCKDVSHELVALLDFSKCRESLFVDLPSDGFQRRSKNLPDGDIKVAHCNG